MNSELAKQLKTCGFPQKTPDMYTFEGDYIPEDEREYWPSLSELISECGNKFDDLTRLDSGDFCCNKWSEAYKPNPELTGSTPEEAVAKLWFKLN